MATKEQINAMKREELDAEAAANGVDPTEYKKADDLRAALLHGADDADGSEQGADEDENANEGTEQDQQRAKQRSDKVQLQNKLRNDAAGPAVPISPEDSLKAVAGTGHPTNFDPSGNPTFGTNVMDSTSLNVAGSGNAAADKAADEAEHASYRP